MDLNHRVAKKSSKTRIETRDFIRGCIAPLSFHLHVRVIEETALFAIVNLTVPTRMGAACLSEILSALEGRAHPVRES